MIKFCLLIFFCFLLLFTFFLFPKTQENLQPGNLSGNNQQQLSGNTQQSSGSCDCPIISQNTSQIANLNTKVNVMEPKLNEIYSEFDKLKKEVEKSMKD